MEKRRKFLNVSSFMFPLFIGSLYINDLVPDFGKDLKTWFVLMRILFGFIFCLFKFAIL